ncbi:MAG: glycosyltransferase family 4 protein, partial [Cyanobacteriota bacterium]
RFCKMQWTADTILSEANASCIPIGPSIDAAHFSPSSYYRILQSNSPTPITITAMIRTSCARRQPELTADVLHTLHDHFGERVRLFSFGSSDPELLSLGIKPGRRFTNLGRLGPKAVAALMRDTDLFIDASTFQAMGLTAMEAMASGCLVIGPSKGGLPEIVGHDGVPLAECIDTSSREQIVGSCIELINDSTTRKIRAERSLQVSRYHPMIAARRMLDVLFSDA